MDNFDELDSIISSSGRKRKIKAEMFSCKLEKAACYNGEGTAPCIACSHIHTSMITTTTTFVRHLQKHVISTQIHNV